jgi:hypothetical protein
MTIATGVAKQLRYKAEVHLGHRAGRIRRAAPAARHLDARSQEAELPLERDPQRLPGQRHAPRRALVEGTINGELSPGTWKDFMAAAVRKAFASTAAMTGLSITIAGTGPTFTVTRAAGSFITDGVKAGDVVRLTAGSFNAANLNKNLWVISLVAPRSP